MSARDDGGPAFPRRKFTPYPHGGGQWTLEDGMTLRDWFAGQALVGMGQWSPTHPNDYESKARWSYAQADAMLAARAKEPGA